MMETWFHVLNGPWLNDPWLNGLWALGTLLDGAGWQLLAQAAPAEGEAPAVIEAVTIGGTVGAPDLSAWGIFSRADPVVKLVIILLGLASFWSWAIIFEKILGIRRVNRRTDDFEDTFWSGGSVDELFEHVGERPTDPMAATFSAAMREWHRSAESGAGMGQRVRAGLHQRIDRVMHVTLGREMERLERYMTFLASVGSTAPFVGLFGTVWGIMNAFQQIALQKSTNLAVVAPGIAEALFATALGLVAAIPAVVAYNKLSNDLARYANRLESFSGEFSAILSRQLDDSGR